MPNWITIIETPTFRNLASKVTTPEVISELFEFMAKRPKAGDVIQGTGGCRKLRWQKDKHSGKSGGLRVIYYFHNEHIPLYALVVFPKSVQSNISQETKNQLKQMTQEIIHYHDGEQNGKF